MFHVVNETVWNYKPALSGKIPNQCSTNKKKIFTIDSKVKYAYEKILIRHTTLDLIVLTQFPFPPLQN